LFANGVEIVYSDLKVEDSRIILEDCVLYYTIGKAPIKQIVVSTGMYQRGDVDYAENRLKYAQDSKGFKSIEEYVMSYHLSKANLKKLDELLIGDSESTVYVDGVNPLFNKD
jgi:hypothetical protein